MAEIMKGAPAAETITRALILRAEALKRRGVEPCLAILRVGERPDDLAYEHSAVKRCEKIGIRSILKALPADCGQETLLAAIRQINEDERIHGCLMLRPLPPHLDEDAICEALEAQGTVLDNLLYLRMDAEKLTDVFAPAEVGRIYLNFSDPWPKDRHAKRRLPGRTFLRR